MGHSGLRGVELQTNKQQCPRPSTNCFPQALQSQLQRAVLSPLKSPLYHKHTQKKKKKIKINKHLTAHIASKTPKSLPAFPHKPKRYPSIHLQRNQILTIPLHHPP